LAGFLVMLLTSCQDAPKHGPVSARTLKALTRRAESKQAFLNRLNEVDRAMREVLPTVPVHVPWFLQTHPPVIQVRSHKARPVQIMLDTGAARMVMGAKSAAKLGLPTVKADEVQATMIGVVGKETGLVGMAGPLCIGDWQIPAYPCFVRTYHTSGHDIAYPDNILGVDLPARYCRYLTLDYLGKEVVFGFGQAYRPESNRRSSAPFVIREGVVFIELQSGKVKWQAVLDSGSFNGIEISEAIAKKLGVQDQGQVVQDLVLIAVGGTMSSKDARLRSLQLPIVQMFGRRYEKPEVAISPGIPRVGSRFLRDYRVTLDFDQRCVWLEW
jgi:hypothetical protein